jgi:hypothetical protein
MITKKKYKKLLEEERIKLMKEHEEECNRYKTQINQLENFIHDLEISQSKEELEDTLKDYDYAIIVKDYKTLLWNDGRWENHVKRVNFYGCNYGDIPELEIIK